MKIARGTEEETQAFPTQTTFLFPGNSVLLFYKEYGKRHHIPTIILHYRFILFETKE